MKPSCLTGYDIIRQVGNGISSQVYLAIDQLTKKHVALKCMRKDQIPLSGFRRETSVQREVHEHPNIVSVIDIAENATDFCIVQEFIEGGDLATFLLGEYGPNGKTVANSARDIDPFSVFADIVEAVSFMHSKNVVHLDLKPENIFVKKTGEAVISDFGNAYLLKPDQKFDKAHAKEKEFRHNYVSLLTHGTKSYRAPEICVQRENMHDSPLDLKALDVWALGVILFILLCGHFPWSVAIDGGVDRDEKFAQYCKTGELAEWEDIPQDCVFLIRAMLCVNPRYRFTIYDVSNFIERKWGPEYVGISRGRVACQPYSSRLWSSVFGSKGEWEVSRAFDYTQAVAARGISRVIDILSFVLVPILLGLVFFLGQRCALTDHGLVCLFVVVSKASTTLISRLV